jgi:hypothetical protein
METRKKDIINRLEHIQKEGDDSAKPGKVPSELETQEALKNDNLHDDSSLEPDTPGKPIEDDQQ